ncbi:uncharacterized protein LOC114518643 [Dendronephthya gigantea]|uniref:uncharacterized protein LOC114518643 n=1 Tax=Dendronephthya gigantea TaxID=151771 RepID=UPI00106A2F34|nr:uncharacterized protein LOC114518643 [Dendronephthya gigantea]
MDTLNSILKLIERNCFMASLDIKDAYYSVAVNQSDRKYLRFYWQGVLYQYTCLPNGLSSCPRTFTKVLKPPLTVLHKLGHIIASYIDDLFLQGKTYEQCVSNVIDTLLQFDALGFIIHPDKSAFIPSQELLLLGFIINSVEMTITLTPEKKVALKQLCLALISKHMPTIREVAQVIGKIISSFPGVAHGPLYYRALDRNKTEALQLCKGNFDKRMTLSKESKLELRWWAQNILESQNVISRGQPSHILTTDASLTGWGAVYEGSSTGGFWADEEKIHHINYLELLALFLGLQTYCKTLQGTHIRVYLDNTTAIAVINHMGTSHSPQSNTLGKTIWEWCIFRNIWLSAAHIPGVDNTIADSESRSTDSHTEWMLDSSTLKSCNRNIVAKNSGGKSDRDSSFTGLANTILVRQGNANVPSTPGTSSSGETAVTIARSTAGNSSTAQNSGSSSLSLIRQQLTEQGLSAETVNIIMATWRQTTGKQYQCYLLKWISFCQENRINIEQADINDGLKFLTFLYNQGVGYSAINTARSALSAVITLGSHRTFGEHPLVTRFLKGVFELKPSLPRYSVVWDVGVVLKFLQSMPSLENMTLAMLMKKLTTLLALLTAQRCQTLKSLDLDFMQEADNQFVFTIMEKLKTTRAGKHIPPIKILSYPHDIRLCPVAHLKCYITKTKTLRRHSTLLLSYVKPHKPVTNSTIGRWVKGILQESGIDKMFSAHSSRTASSSYGILLGLPLKDVLKAGGWSNAETFAKHYNKPIESNFGNSILNHFINTDTDD